MHYSNGEWWPAWALLFLPYLAWLWRLCRKTFAEVNWPAAVATVLVFELVLTPAEVYSVARGHWVYNEARIWGVRLFHVPLEEHLLYYLFSPLLVITIMHAWRMILKEREAR